MARKKIGLAGFWENQIADMKTRFPHADFVAVEGTNVGSLGLDALVAITQDALDALFKPEVLDKCKALKWVHASSAGIDDYLPHLPDSGFTLTCGKIIQGPNVADHGMALLLALTRRLPWLIRGVERSAIPRPTELRGKRALIIGLGGIGMSLAERCRAFGMRVDAVTENLMPLVSFVDRVFLSDELSVALADADVVFIAAPETPASRRLINRDALAAMKDSAYLINVSRGAIVDLDALIETLEKGRLEAVGLDVTDPEPLPANHPIFGFDRVLITPHYAGITTQHTRRFDLIYTNVRRFLAGLPLVNVVDKHLGY